MGIFNWINGQAGGTPLSAENLNQMQLNLLDMIFPVGSTYVTQSANTTPNAVLGIGTWERFNGLVALGVDESDTNMNAVGKTGGEKTHTLTTNEMPRHNHPDIVTNGQGNREWGYNFQYTNTAGGNSGASGYTGGSQAHNNMQPYEVVGYMWIRRA